MLPGRSSERGSYAVAVPHNQIIFHPEASREVEKALIGYQSQSLLLGLLSEVAK